MNLRILPGPTAACLNVRLDRQLQDLNKLPAWGICDRAHTLAQGATRWEAVASSKTCYSVSGLLTKVAVHAGTACTGVPPGGTDGGIPCRGIRPGTRNNNVANGSKQGSDVDSCPLASAATTPSGMRHTATVWTPLPKESPNRVESRVSSLLCGVRFVH